MQCPGDPLARLTVGDPSKAPLLLPHPSLAGSSPVPGDRWILMCGCHSLSQTGCWSEGAPRTRGYIPMPHSSVGGGTPPAEPLPHTLSQPCPHSVSSLRPQERPRERGPLGRGHTARRGAGRSVGVLGSWWCRVRSDVAPRPPPPRAGPAHSGAQSSGTRAECASCWEAGIAAALTRDRDPGGETFPAAEIHGLQLPALAAPSSELIF